MAWLSEAAKHPVVRAVLIAVLVAIADYFRSPYQNHNPPAHYGMQQHRVEEPPGLSYDPQY